MTSACASITRRSAETRSPAVEEDDVADDQLGGVDLERRPVAQHHGPARQQVAQAFGGVLGTVLLDEGEDPVDDDDDEDGDAELGQAGDEGEHARRPKA